MFFQVNPVTQVYVLAGQMNCLFIFPKKKKSITNVRTDFYGSGSFQITVFRPFFLHRNA